MTGFLVDVHIPLGILGACRRLMPDVDIEHVSRWHDGSLRMASDEAILTAAAGAGYVVVTYDVHSFRALADRWVAESRTFPGVVLVLALLHRPYNVGSREAQGRT